MKTIIDTSSIVNLVNAGAHELVLAESSRTFHVGPEVAREFRDGGRDELDRAIASGQISKLDDADLPASLFLSLLDKHSLGLGETECIAFAITTGYFLCSDDRKARMNGKAELGESRVLGSLRLLKELVESETITADIAFHFYKEMRRLGAFLPDVTVEYFQ